MGVRLARRIRIRLDLCQFPFDGFLRNQLKQSALAQILSQALLNGTAPMISRQALYQQAISAIMQDKRSASHDHLTWP